MSKLSYKARAAAGAAVLDELDPDWFWSVDTDALDIMNGNDCILGQLFGGWAPGGSKVSDHFGWAAFPSRDWMATHGFQATREELMVESPEQYFNSMRLLENRWTDEINTRRAAA